MAQGSVAFNLTDLCLCLVIFWSRTWHDILCTLCVAISVCMQVLMSSRGESITVLCCLWITICICMYSVLSFIKPQLSAFGFKWCCSSDTSTQVQIQKQPISILTKNSGHELVNSNKLFSLGENNWKSFSLYFLMVSNDILCVLYLPYSSVHDFDGDNQVYIENTCVDLNISAHPGFTW